LAGRPRLDGDRPCSAVRTARSDRIADLVRADRQRLLERVDELTGLDRLMRERGTLAEPDEPPPLHRASRNTETTEEKTT
jgi:hypothetical protein